MSDYKIIREVYCNQRQTPAYVLAISTSAIYSTMEAAFIVGFNMPFTDVGSA